MQIAFIGLGNMGGPMAINLHKAGHTVKAFDLSKDACAKVAAEGVTIAASAEDAVQGAEASKNYAGGFGTDLMLKDLGLAQENAMAVKASTPLGGMARAMYAMHSIAGNGALDFSSVIRSLQKNG
jgi:3-hydroxyisobutyrate dehydrogenase-like beta-hydroxyacid dehydrogenase